MDRNFPEGAYGGNLCGEQSSVFVFLFLELPLLFALFILTMLALMLTPILLFLPLFFVLEIAGVTWWSILVAIVVQVYFFGLFLEFMERIDRKKSKPSHVYIPVKHL
jgi:polyferredoxin